MHRIKWISLEKWVSERSGHDQHAAITISVTTSIACGSVRGLGRVDGEAWEGSGRLWVRTWAWSCGPGGSGGAELPQPGKDLVAGGSGRGLGHVDLLLCGAGRTLERENTRFRGSGRRVEPYLRRPGKTRGFVGQDVRWSVKTRGFVDPGVKRISSSGRRGAHTARTNFYLDVHILMLTKYHRQRL